MEPIEFIKSCFAIACVLIAFAIFIKVSFALVDWLVERIKEDTLKLRINKDFSVCLYDSKGDLCTQFVSVNVLTAIYKQAKELGWIESGPEQETNYEHYKEDIAEFFIDNLAVVNGRPRKCNDTDCDRDCDLCSTCDKDTYHGLLINWLNQPYKEPTYKLTQFEYDLLRTNNIAQGKSLNDFAIYKNLRSVGYFRGIDFDLKIEDILANCEVIQ